jgi:Icc-related predicted phosphoesterase
MTKLWILSDLHLEFADLPWPVVAPDADACVVAGDVLPGCREAVRWLGENIAPLMPVVYVAGNHEFYGDFIADGRKAGAVEAELWPDVHFLENDFALIDGVRFVGATLWTDFALRAERASDIAWSERAAEGLMADYRAILGRSSKDPHCLRAGHTADMHAYSRVYIEQVLSVPFDGPTVVVSHHAPHPGSIAPEFRDSGLNPAFVSDLTEVIDRYEPGLWVHGHVHTAFDYRVGETRVVCNPRGYPGERNDWNSMLTVEV